MSVAPKEAYQAALRLYAADARKIEHDLGVAPSWGPTHDGSTPQFSITPATDAEFHVRPRAYLVDGLITEGRLTLFAGSPGQGKSKMSCKLIAAVTQGKPFAGRATKAGEVVLYSTEDSFCEDTLPCLENEGVDRSKLHVYQGDLDLPGIAGFLQHNPGIRLIVLDPAIDVAMQGNLNPNDAIAIRKALAPIQALCKVGKVTTLGLVHFRKADGSGLDSATAIDRVSGSGAWGQVARGVIVFAPSKDHPPEDHVKLMIQAKSQQSAGLGGWQYRIQCDPTSPWPDTATVQLEAEPVAGTPEQLLSGASRLTQKGQCSEDVLHLLDDARGWVKRKDITDQLEAEYSTGTINASFSELNARAAKEQRSGPNTLIKGTRHRYGRYCLNKHVHRQDVELNTETLKGY